MLVSNRFAPSAPGSSSTAVPRYRFAPVALASLCIAGIAGGVILLAQSRPVASEPTTVSAGVYSPAAITYTPPQHDTWYLDPSWAPAVARPAIGGTTKDRWYSDVQPPAVTAWSSSARDRWYLERQFVMQNGIAAGDTQTQEAAIPTHDDWALASMAAYQGANEDGPGTMNAIAVVAVALALVASPQPVGAQQQSISTTTLAERRVAQLPTGALAFRIETYGSRAEAEANAGPTGLVAEMADSVYLVTVGVADDPVSGQTELAEVGPLEQPSASEYLLRVVELTGPAGSTAAPHTHPGAESYYVFSGDLGVRTPAAELHAGA